MDSREHLELQVPKVSQDNRALQVLVEVKDLRDHKVSKVSKVQQVPLVQPEIQGHQEPQVALVLLAAEV